MKPLIGNTPTHKNKNNILISFDKYLITFMHTYMHTSGIALTVCTFGASLVSYVCRSAASLSKSLLLFIFPELGHSKLIVGVGPGSPARSRVRELL